MAKKILFLCTGNSCRSQMAEAIVNHELNGTWKAYSAGTLPAGYTHPKAVQVLQEIGIVHTGESKHVDKFKDEVFDRVITVCDSAAEECPVWLGKGIQHHLSFPDPAKATGTDQQITETFRKVRDQISHKILDFLERHQPPENQEYS